AMVLAMGVGGFMALARLSRSPFVRLPSVAYIEFFRAMPLLLLIFFTAQLLPKYGLRLGVFWYLVIALTAYNSAVLAEIFRSGAISVSGVEDLAVVEAKGHAAAATTARK